MAVFFQIPDVGYAAVQNRLGFLSYIIFDGNAISIMTALINQHGTAIKRERYRSLARASRTFGHSS